MDCTNSALGIKICSNCIVFSSESAIKSREIYFKKFLNEGNITDTEFKNAVIEHSERKLNYMFFASKTPKEVINRMSLDALEVALAIAEENVYQSDNRIKFMKEYYGTDNDYLIFCAKHGSAKCTTYLIDEFEQKPLSHAKITVFCLIKGMHSAKIVGQCIFDSSGHYVSRLDYPRRPKPDVREQRPCPFFSPFVLVCP